MSELQTGFKGLALVENLEGGIEHVKDVVIKDSLGICDQLEEEMQHVINTYQCEWRTTVESPEKRKRFRFFVNSDEQDNNVLFVEERGQLRPQPRKSVKRITIS